MAPNRTLDIHSYELKTRQAREQLRRSSLSDHNKDLILRYCDACLVKGVCGTVRLIRVIGTLRLFGQLLQRDFDTLNRSDLEGLIGMLLQRSPAYSAETLGTYRAILKTFMTWVLVPEEFPTKTPPAMVSWLSASVRTKDKHRLHRNDLITPKDIEAVLTCCHNPRDKALISNLWETGGRISELGNLQLKHVTKQLHGYLLDLYGKTGHRNPLVISSAPYLTQWIANHPFRHDPESPLWVHYQFATTPKHLKYDTIRTLLRRYFKRANITKPYHPHIFRHSRATYVLASGVMNEQQAKAYFGWTPSSKMLSTYAHLLTSDANNAILAEHHLLPPARTAEGLTTIPCPTCSELNTGNATHCTRCTNPLDTKTLHEQQATRDHKDALLFKVVEVLVSKGLLDEAADIIHNAGLAPKLQTLAQPNK